MHYQCMASDCEHTFKAEPKNDKFDLFTNCPKCGCVAEFTDGLATPRDIMEVRGDDCIEQRYHGLFDTFSNCPFAYDCYLQGQYITNCETQEYISHSCLVHIDGKLYSLEKKLDKILAYLEKSSTQ
ncbi:hypothetical protein CFT13S00388_09455 [Campylobacter fetus subsp. testudinum]|uniref:hypothetical protein n=1 Tax=Campylobacter fetus TaxID=196 RepID=UPI00081882BA|nr:hypothetical protein [Campylobacter fetus]OCR85514.1 hypothetical protein CFT13S00388_09455 [Campylobacter fetus subsp. testudinum]